MGYGNEFKKTLQRIKSKSFLRSWSFFEAKDIQIELSYLKNL